MPISPSDDVCLAVDLGASSGRVLAARLCDGRIELDEVHRFMNGPVHIGKRLHWNLLEQWTQIELGLTAAAARFGKQIRSVGVDTWGVDYCLLDDQQDLVGPAFCYRDARTSGMMARAFEKISRESIFAESGLQFMEINTLYQLFAMRTANSKLLEIADRFLMVPDFFHWLLSGEMVNERTNASTTQMLRAIDGKWSDAILTGLDIPRHLFSDCCQPGTDLGMLRPDLARRTGLTDVRTIVPTTHDTAAAVLAVPAAGFASPKPSWCYISSGTWSLMGVELDQPNLSQDCLDFNFTNEGGIEDSTRLLKNISGLWPYQQCRSAWQRLGREYSWEELTAMAKHARPLKALFNPDHPSLVAPENMISAIQDLYRKGGEPVLDEPGSIARSALESLGMRYRTCLGTLETLLGYRIETIHIVGGGSQNDLLCQMTADATQREVLAGPVEATAIGNALSQWIGQGILRDASEARRLVSAAVETKRYSPQASNASAWDDAYYRFVSLCELN